jgi:hypothetical protein
LLLATYFELMERRKMPKDERDFLEVLKFDLIEETVGSWLRAIIQRLEKEQGVVRRDQHKQRTASHERLRGTPRYQKHHPKRTNLACPAVLHRRGQVLPISSRSGFGKLV